MAIRWRCQTGSAATRLLSNLLLKGPTCDVLLNHIEASSYSSLTESQLIKQRNLFSLLIQTPSSSSPKNTPIPDSSKLFLNLPFEGNVFWKQRNSTFLRQEFYSLSPLILLFLLPINICLGNFAGLIEDPNGSSLKLCFWDWLLLFIFWMNKDRWCCVSILILTLCWMIIFRTVDL